MFPFFYQVHVNATSSILYFFSCVVHGKLQLTYIVSALCLLVYLLGYFFSG